jgi:Cu+-exporting ATPase
MAKDPVCGMTVDENKAAATATHQGSTYYFCAAGCKSAFEKDPGKYLGAKGVRAGAH